MRAHSRILYGIGGAICFVIGLASLALPILPGVPILILAAFLLSRASPRLHDAMLSLPGIGKLLAAPKGERTIKKVWPRILVGAIVFAALAAAGVWIWMRERG